MRAVLLIALLLLVFTFGCLNYFRSTKDCGTDLSCFKNRIEYECEKARVLVPHEYGTISLESQGAIWTDSVDRNHIPRCRMTIKVEKVNEDKIPQAQKDLMSSYGIPPSTISLASMECLMTSWEFSKVYEDKDKEIAKEVYETCSGTLKVIADKVPAIKEAMGAESTP